MNRIKTLLIVFLFIAMSVTFTGCGLVGALSTNRTEISSNFGEDLPEWLTVAHRVQVAVQPQLDTKEDEGKENEDAGPLVSQPASNQPNSTQPSQQAEQPTQTGTPRWQQPGTMEYIAKQQLDTVAFHYKRLNTEIADLDGEKDKDEVKLKALRKERTERYEIMSEVAGSIGLSLEKEYGIKPPPADVTETNDETWFHNWEHSPSGFGD